MDGQANRKQQHRTLASQPAAVAHVGAPSFGALEEPAAHGAPPVASVAGARRSRLERMLLAARQMQQH
jgi:hypothetical protein